MQGNKRKRSILAMGLIMVAGPWTVAQTLKPRPPAGQERNQEPATPVPAPAPPIAMDMSIPAGTPIKVATVSEVRLKKVGQPIRAKTIEPVYAFDKLLIPAGTTVNGKVSEIDRVPARTRTMQALDGNFSPVRTMHVQFDDLVMKDGRHISMHTSVSPAPNGVLNFVPANAREKKKNKLQSTASQKVDQTKQQIHQQWSDLQQQIHQPGKLHKLLRRAMQELPVHPQYIDAGTSFNADLEEPLNFGTEIVKQDALSEIGSPPPSGSVVHARLVTALSSATSKKGEAVEALITQPLVVSDHLILPEGSVIRGSVMQVQPARRMAHNGQLRILFREVAPPNGLEQKVEASLEGVAVAKGENLKLDSEGGAQVTTPKTRYLTTGIQVALAATSAMPDNDARAGGGTSSGGADWSGSAANGASGFRLVGMIIGIAARSRPVATGFGAYGAATAIYYHFLARGRDVVYPKDMAMVVGLGTRDNKSNAGIAAGSAEIAAKH